MNGEKRISSIRIFYRNAVRQRIATGAIAPSSPFLARAITRCVAPGNAPVRILEAGPGTGPFSRRLAAKLRPGDRLDLCEVNEDFVNCLRRKLQRDRVFKKRAGQIHILHQPVQSLKGEDVYDFIVSGLPLNNFPAELVTEILEEFKRLLKPGGKLAFFEYYLVRNMQRPFIRGPRRENLDRTGAVLLDHLKNYERQKIFVPLNVPPSIVHVCQYQ